MTGRDLTVDVLEDIGYLGPGDMLAAEDAQKFTRRANQWINSLALEPLTIFYVLRTVRLLAANVPSLTIGTGGDINIARPTALERAGLLLDTNASPVTETPIDVYTDQDYDGIQQKGLASPYVRGVFFDRNWVNGLGTIKLYPVPTIGTTSLVLYTLQALTGFPDLNTDISYPDGVEEFLRTSLAIKVARAFGQLVTPDMQQAAAEAKTKYKRSNQRAVVLGIPAAVPGLRSRGGYDVRTDSTRA